MRLYLLQLSKLVLEMWDVPLLAVDGGDWFFKKSCDEAKERVTRPGTALSQ